MQSHPVALPEPVCELLGIIEHFTGTQVISIGNVRNHLSLTGLSVGSIPISALA